MKRKKNQDYLVKAGCMTLGFIIYICIFVYYSCVAYPALSLVFLISFSFKLMKAEFEHVDQAALSHQVLDSAAWPSSISFTSTDILKILVTEGYHMEEKIAIFLLYKRGEF